MDYNINLNNITRTSTFIEKGQLFLSIEGQTSHGRFIIPKISLNSLTYTQEIESSYYGKGAFASFSSAEITCKVLPVDDVLIEFIGDEEPAQEMTVAQIQKELGYKIKIKE